MARVVDRDAKRGQIIEAAAGVFARKGFEAALIGDVAVAAGVSKGSLYDYFDSKERLFFAVFERGQRQVLAASAAQCPSGASAKEKMVTSPKRRSPRSSIKLTSTR